MVGLPKSLDVGGVEYPIRSDYRVVLNIFEAYNDPNLTDNEKLLVMLRCLYVTMPPDIDKAAERAVWFLDGGMPEGKERTDGITRNTKLLDWVQDEQLIFSAINQSAGCELRAVEYCHWFTFLGYFNNIGEGLFSTVLSIRTKKAKGKKLDKHEEDFFREHKDLVLLKKRYTDVERQEIKTLNRIFK